jgi:hypothetical protein
MRQVTTLFWFVALAGCANAPAGETDAGSPTGSVSGAGGMRGVEAGPAPGGSPAGAVDASTPGTAPDARSADTGVAPPAPVGSADAAMPAAPDARVVAPLPPPAARPPAPPPDGSAVVFTLAAERPDLLADSCVAQGGTNAFLFEVAHRLRALDPRWGLVLRDGALLQDRIGYFWGDGAPEGRAEIYVLDVVARHCARPGVDEPAAPAWLDDSAAGGVFTLGPLSGESPPSTPDAGSPPPPERVALPDHSQVLRDLAAERPELLAASCVDQGGDNQFLFEGVRRLRALDPRWGLNWKRGNVGDMSQDAIDYFWAAGDAEGRTEVYILDVIGGHCGDSPEVAWIDVTQATLDGGTIGRWTLQPLPQ